MTDGEHVMAFKFHDAVEIYANAVWRQELTVNPGGPGGVVTMQMLVNAMEAEINFERARIWARKRTPTGLRLMDSVRNAKETIHVVAWRSSDPAQPGFSMFSSDSPQPGEGTIYVNLDQMVSIAQVNPEDARKNNMLNNFVLILHEVGHAKQFIDNPAWFRLNQGTGDYINNEKAVVLDAVARQTGKAWGIEAKALRIMGNPHKAFSSAIEWENYIYNEGPICDEIGVARRIFYANLNQHFGDTFTSGKHKVNA
jgi:hypothetical protein